ncbi:putative disease resistance protein At4g19050 isoform X2 [Pistacia vera]|uniref:putative disease resistance protein At4g19050 isoform X2 n=1 Tax=Pistacia vera TaxID=55513 RepID=UPI001263B835|nr:putative disease resistance protein At4g19050 isoform X2 [Pistacia vera]
MAGNVIQTPELNSLPNDVCKECGGLPIIICTIAKALRNRRQKSQWEDALRILRMPSPAKFTRLLEKEYSKIKLSYDYLEDDELKKTFIISSLMENDTSISNLLKNIVRLGILEGANLTIEQARNRLDSVVKELKDSCLLLDGRTKRRFSMHDVVRIVALTCAYTDHHVFTERNDIESEWKDKDKLRKCTIISLVGNKIITQLWPEALDCPELEFLNMSERGSSFEIPKEFFMVMPKLKVLNLSRVQKSSLPSSFDLLTTFLNLFRIQKSSLPSSLGLLTNLQTLCLDGSEIEDVAIIGKLKQLKVLSLRNTRIKNLPTEMDQLTGLKFLDLSNCWQLKVIVPNVISKLLQLEELYIKGCNIQWKVFFSRELRRYKISMGNEWWNSYGWPKSNYKFSRILKFKYDSTISLEELRILKNVELLGLVEFSDDDNNLTPLFNKKVIFYDLTALALEVTSSRKIWDSQPPTFMSSLAHLTLKGCKKIKYAFSICIVKSLQALQYLVIRDCEVLEQIVAEEGVEAVVTFAFPQITFLMLENLPKLTAFCHGIDTWELPMLEGLVVKECEKFTSKYLSFHENSLRILDNEINHDLEVFNLKDGAKEVIWQSHTKALKISYDNSTDIPLGLIPRFENLNELRLYLPDQYKELSFPNLPNLEVLDVQGCSKLISLVSSSASFQNLKVLRVFFCNGLMKLITPSMARGLVQLREMSVEYCEMLIEIVENEGDATTTEIVFNNLNKLSLTCLESLTCFCSGNYLFNFPSLEDLIIRYCPNMKTFSQGILSTPKLQKVNYESFKETEDVREEEEEDWERMEVENEENDLNKTIQGAYKKQDISLYLKFLTFQDDSSTEICYNQHPNSFYQNLTHLILSGCENIKFAFPSSIAQSLHKLQYLKIHNCKVLEEIVAKEEGANGVVNFVFPHVTFFKLEDLPKLRAFYPEIHTSEWPMLKELLVINCDKLSSKYLSFKENNEENGLNISNPNSIFLDDKINNDLEVFELKNGRSWGEKWIIWQSQSKALEIGYDNSVNIPLGFLQRFENLNELKLFWCDQYKELFFPNLPTLEVLNLQDCIELMSLMSCSASFQNLKVLRVDHCERLMKLITPSTARGLVQLREMSVEYCGMLVEIVENKGDATTTEIVFNNLNKLSFTCLNNLTCFCSGNYSFNFPSLEDLIIRFCPNMKTFSQGILSTPKLHTFYYDNCEMDLESGGSELNATIQKEHKEKVLFCKYCVRIRFTYFLPALEALI